LEKSEEFGARLGLESTCPPADHWIFDFRLESVKAFVWHEPAVGLGRA
jgi:hypothetical protein